MKRTPSFFICLLTIIISSFIFISCSSSEQTLRQLHIGMSKDEVIDKMGNPYVVRGSMQNKDGDIVEVWEYWLKHDAILAQDEQANLYWIYIVNDRLAQWGRAGDWDVEKDHIYEMRFR